MSKEEKASAGPMATHIEELIALWVKDVNDSASSGQVKTRFHYLGELVKEKYGEGGFLSWAMIILGTAHAAYFQGKLSADWLNDIKAQFEPVVRQLLDKPESTH